MNKQAVLKMIDKIRVAYPSRKYYESKEDLKTLVDMWLDLFNIFTEKFMNMALMGAITKSDYPPSFSAIRTSVDELLHDYQEQIHSVQDQIEHWESMLDYCREEEKLKYQEYKEKAEEELRELKEFKIYD